MGARKKTRFDETLSQMANLAKAKRRALRRAMHEDAPVVASQDRVWDWERDPSLLPKKPPGRA